MQTMKNRLSPVLEAVVVVMLVGFAAAIGSAVERQAANAASAIPTTKPDDLDRLLAPIALYPDQLLSPMLLSAANPGKLGALEEWLASNQALTGAALQDAARQAGFDPSFVALVPFPQVIGFMTEQVDWTSRLGKAFEADRTAVFASIQRLRAAARKTGTLKSTTQQTVDTRTTSNGEQVIVIEPANPQVVYVPQYNPQVVYTQPATSSTVVVESGSDANAAAAGLIGFTAGIAIGAAIDNDYYYGPYGWHGGFYMYDDAWDDWYDAREDAREDWQDYREDTFEDRSERREDIADERGDRARTTQEQRTERQQTRQDNASATRAEPQSATARGTGSGTSSEARGYSGDGSRAAQRSGGGSDAFSGYSSGRSERAASERGNRSRSSSRGGGGRRR
jgi:hypothetical protein